MSDTQEKIVFVFNRIFINFLKEIKSNADYKKLIKKHYKSIDKYSDVYLERFLEKTQDSHTALCNPNFNLITSYIDSGFSKVKNEPEHYKRFVEKDGGTAEEQLFRQLLTTQIFRKITLGHLLKTFESEQRTISSYFLTLYLLAFVHQEHSSHETEVESEAESEVNEEEESEVHEEANEVKENPWDDMFQRVVELLTAIGSGSLTEEEFNEKYSNIEHPDVKTLLKQLFDLKISIVDDDMPQQESVDDLISNSKLGKLAKDISDKIDINSLNLENFKMEDLLNPQTLFGGGENNVIGNIVKQAGEAITEKVSSGELSQNEIIEDAMNVMSQMQSGASENPLLGGLMQNMSGLFSGLNANANPDSNEEGNATQNQEMDADALMEMMSSMLEQNKPQKKGQRKVRSKK